MSNQPAKPKLSGIREFVHLSWRLWHHYARPQCKYFFWSVPLSLLAGAATAVQAYLFEPAIDKVIINGDPLYLWVIPLVFFVASLARGLSIYTQNVMIAAATERIVVGLQRDLFDKLVRLDMAFFHQYGGAPQVGRFMTDVRYIREGSAKMFTALPKELCTVAGMIGLMAYHSVWLTVLVVFLMPVFVLPVRYVGQKIRHIAAETQEQAGRLTSVLDQALGAIRQIKIANRYNDENARASKVFHGMRQLLVKITSYNQLLSPLNECIKAICFAFVVVLGGVLVQEQAMTVGALTSFLVAMLGLFSPVRVLMRINTQIQTAIAGMTRTYELLDREPQIIDQPSAAELCITRGNIRLENISFAYNDRVNVLDDLNLCIPGGQTTALVGLSGSGKSSILSLIARLYNPAQGTITVDDQDLAGVTQASLHRHMAYISQEVELFDLSIGDNVAYACPSASEDNIWHVLDLVGLKAFVDDLPDGLQTMIGEGGVKISGGQRQRLAFARALLSQARIVLMDEATSALDSESESYLQSAINHFPQNATIIVVAHRLSTIAGADQICVIDGGKVLERGTHQSLLVAGGAYARLYRYQHLARD